MTTNISELVTPEKAKELQLTFLERVLGLSRDYSQTLMDMISEPTPEEHIKTRPARGGKAVPYIPGYRFIQRFNECFGPLWSYAIADKFEKDGQIVVLGRWSLKIPGRTIERILPDGTREIARFDGFEIFKEQFGSSEVKRYANDDFRENRKTHQRELVHKKGDIIDLGDDYKGGATDAMKKCGTELGMYLDVYGQREEESESGVTKQQYSALYMRGKEAGMEESATKSWAAKELGKTLEEADQLEVMGLIPKLVDMARAKKDETAQT